MDCRVSLQYDSVENKSKNMQYFASEAENTEFIMPIVIPTKEEWIPNDKVCKKYMYFTLQYYCF